MPPISYLLFAIDIGAGGNIAIGNVFSRTLYADMHYDRERYSFEIIGGYNKTGFLDFGINPFFPSPGLEIVSEAYGPLGAFLLNYGKGRGQFSFGMTIAYFYNEGGRGGSPMVIPSLGVSLRSSRDDDGSFVKLRLYGEYGLTKFKGFSYVSLGLSLSVFPFSSSVQQESQP